MLFFDTETFSELDVKKVGSAKYARHHSTKVLMITWCYDSGPAYICEPEIEPLPDDLLHALNDPQIIKRAANISFDRDILKYCLGIDIPLSSCADLFALAYSLGFTGSMEKIGEQIGVSEDKAKLKEGKKLIHRFCKPQPSNHKIRLRTRETDPVDWERFRQYALRDAESLREQWNLLSVHNSMSAKEWHYWRLTMEMNERGIPVDRELIRKALHLVAERKRQIKNELIGLTGLENPNSNQQMLQWLAAYGYNLPNMQAATVDKLIPNVKNPLVKDVLIKKRALGQTAPTKWKAFDVMACDDDLVRGVITYRGASRTGRDASRGVNFQNLKRPPEGDMDDHVKVIQTNDLEFIKLIHGEPLDFLSKTVRAAVTAPEGYSLAVSDLSSIESRIIGWLTNCQRMNHVFASGLDTYKDFAVELYGVPYDQVTKKQRTFAKPPFLGCFAEDTEVLTDSGWKPITQVTTGDRLWDGIKWVKHLGVIYQGKKNVIEKLGVLATSNHLILKEKDRWVSWGSLEGLKVVLEIYTASGSLWSMIESIGCADVPAENSNGCTHPICTVEKPEHVLVAQMLKMLRTVQATLSSTSTKSIGLGWLTDIMHKYLGVKIETASTTNTTEVEASSVTLMMFMMQSAILSLYQDGITLNLRLIELIITDIMSTVTYDSSINQEMPIIRGRTGKLNITGDNIQQNSSKINSRQSTEIEELLHEKSVKDYLLKRLLPNRKIAEVSTYDILNSGDLNRYTIKTSYGAIVVHNCCYGLSANGLVAYAESMGVEMSHKDADHAVKKYRSIYPEISKFWYTLDEIVERVVRTHNTEYAYNMTFRYENNFLFIRLPSGRDIAYYQPIYSMWDTPVGIKPTFTYMGINRYNLKWERIPGRGATLTENIVQALARDVMMEWVDRLPTLDIRLRVHDELVAVVKSEHADQWVEHMNEVIRKPIDWAPGLLLDAEGGVTKHYGKG